jgi:hypothetical protein
MERLDENIQDVTKSTDRFLWIIKEIKTMYFRIGTHDLKC